MNTVEEIQEALAENATLRTEKHEDAEAIGHLRAENERLREALEKIAHNGEGWLNLKRTKIVARAALKGGDQ